VLCTKCKTPIIINTGGDDDYHCFSKNNYPDLCDSCYKSERVTKQWAETNMREITSKKVSDWNLNRMASLSIEERREFTKEARRVYNEKYPNHTSPFLSEESLKKANSTNGKRKTFIERKLRFFLDQLGVSYQTDFYIKRKELKLNGQNKGYYPDIYIPNLNLILEADGILWHNKEDDNIRDENIKELIGADVFRFSENDIRNNGDIVFNEIKNIVKNHSGLFVRIPVKVTDVHKVQAFSNILYNFSVQDDESYVADGVVVHNCRCNLRHLADYMIWDKKKKEFVYDSEELKRKEQALGMKGKIVITIGDKVITV
jgi:very-short-patch-repair endonuclease